MLSTRKLSRLSIADIRDLVDTAEPDTALVRTLYRDKRAGVQALARRMENQIARAENIARRRRELTAFENRLREEGAKVIAGIDEAGRGPLAGPVVAAAVVLPEDADIPGLDDSKKLTPEKRERLFGLVTKQALAWSVGMIDHDEIDHINILRASLKAMRTAVATLGMEPDIALIDGNQSAGLSCTERMIVEGDSRCYSIAAASVVAKVMRDRIMIDMDEVYPGYGFAGHKGYGSELHRNALAEHGPCAIHRLSFRIVPELAPAGRLAELLAIRLRTALDSGSLSHAASAVNMVREYLAEPEIERLRDLYRTRAAALTT